MLEVRKELGAQHKAYIASNADKILMAGGLRFGVDTPFMGGAWLVKAPNRAEVESLVTSDPYYNPDHRRFDISHWGVFHHSFVNVELNNGQ